MWRDPRPLGALQLVLALASLLTAGASLAAPPANDGFAGAETITSAPFLSGSVSTHEATADPGEPAHARSTAGHSVWWRIQLAEVTDVLITTEGSDFDTVLAVYSGTELASLVELDSNDDSTGQQSSVFVRLEAGVSYHIAVDGFAFEGVEQETGEVRLGVERLDPNDGFADATPLVGFPTRAFAHTGAATREAGEPWHTGQPGNHSVWWRWTAATTRAVSVDTVGSDFDTLLALYQGAEPEALTLLASNDDAFGSTQSQVTFEAQAGTTYSIAVDGYEDSSGKVVLSVGSPADTLVIDDTQGDPDTLALVSGVAQATGLAVDVWDTRNGSPFVWDLDRYGSVLWLSGESGRGPDADAEESLDLFMSGVNKCLLVSSQDYTATRGVTAFLRDVLGVASASEAALSSVVGTGPLAGFLETTPLSFPGADRSDRLTSTSQTFPLILGPGGQTAGTFRFQESGRGVFVGFPIEALPIEQMAVLLSFGLSACGPSLVTPGGQAVLAGSSQTFSWTEPPLLGDVLDVEAYWLSLGSHVGGSDLYNSGLLSQGTRSVVVSGLPMDGAAIFARLFYRVGGTWLSNDSSLGAADPPALLEPVDPELEGSTARFSWGGSSQAEAWWLYLGSTPGGRDVYGSGDLGHRTSTVVPGLPTDGRSLYARLFFKVAGRWDSIDRVFAAADLPVVPPSLSADLPGSGGTLDWSPGSVPASAWWVYVGSAPGGSELFDSGNLGATTHIDLAGLPTDGRTLHVRLWYRTADGPWEFVDHTLTAADIPVFPPTVAAAISDATARFDWQANGTPANEWWLHIGSAAGGRDLHNSGNLADATSQVVAGLPTDGRTLYARLWYRPSGGDWQSVDATFTAADLPVFPPTLDAHVADSTGHFDWQANGTPADAWWLHVGSGPGQRDLHDSGNLSSATSRTVDHLPTDGRTLYLRLWYRVAGTWKFLDTTATAADLPPFPTAQLDGLQLEWQRNGSGADAWWVYLGTSIGASDVLDSGNLGSATSLATPGPTPGFSHVRLWYRTGGIWLFEDFVLRPLVTQQGDVLYAIVAASLGFTGLPTPLVPLGIDPADQFTGGAGYLLLLPANTTAP